MLSPEQLSKLAEAGLPDGTSVTIAEQDDVTFELQKGRLEKDGEGSTIVVRGGMDYDSDTGTVTVNSPLGSGPDGLLVDTNGKVLHSYHCNITVFYVRFPVEPHANSWHQFSKRSHTYLA